MPSDAVIEKWLGEPIKAAILPTSIFLTNKKGFPVLSKAHQRIIFNLFKVNVDRYNSNLHPASRSVVQKMWILFCSWRPSLSSQEPAATLKRTSDRTCSTWNTSTKTGPHQTPTSSLPRATKTTYSPHSRSGSSPLIYVGWMYVLHVCKAQTDWCSEAYRHEARIIVFSSPFYNFWNKDRFVFYPCSSQPLMDNLESQTYEVFEKDPIKYSQYQQVRKGGTQL